MSRWTDLAPRQEHTANEGGQMSEFRGVVLHIAQGTYEGTISWQKNPSADVSSHFIAGKNAGERCQMVDTATVAWTQVDGNGHWLSIENAGSSGEKLTENQLDFAAQILARAHTQYNVPLQLANTPSAKGLGYHAMGGVAWGNHPDCPGNPIINQRQDIINRAQAILGGTVTVSKDDAVLVTQTTLTYDQADDIPDEPGKSFSVRNRPWRHDGDTNKYVQLRTAIESAWDEAHFANVAATSADAKCDQILAALANGAGGGLTVDQIRAIVREELDKTKLST